MPTNKPDYRSKNGWKNYKKYQWSKLDIKKRAARNKARKDSGLKKWDTREVDHKNWNPLDNSKKNKRIISRKRNRILWAAKANKTKWRIDWPNLFYV